jgi:hypothetical protein
MGIRRVPRAAGCHQGFRFAERAYHARVINDIRASLPSAPARSGQRRGGLGKTGPKVCGAQLNCNR